MYGGNPESQKACQLKYEYALQHFKLVKCLDVCSSTAMGSVIVYDACYWAQPCSETQEWLNVEG
jgi:hypothetical protein